MRQRSENLGESPCPSAIAGQGGHQDFHEIIESQRSPRKAILSRTYIKEKRAFLIEIKVVQNRGMFGLEKDSIQN